MDLVNEKIESIWSILENKENSYFDRNKYEFIWLKNYRGKVCKSDRVSLFAHKLTFTQYYVETHTSFERGTQMLCFAKDSYLIYSGQKIFRGQLSKTSKNSDLRFRHVRWTTLKILFKSWNNQVKTLDSWTWSSLLYGACIQRFLTWKLKKMTSQQYYS